MVKVGGSGEKAVTISTDAVALVTLCVDRPPSPAVCKRSPASTRVDHQIAGSEQVRDAMSC